MGDFNELIQLGKDKVAGVISDTWSQIGARFGISGNAAKKRFYKWRKRNENQNNKQQFTNEEDKLKNLLRQIEREKIKVRQEKNELIKLQRAFARTELMCEYITEGIKNLTPLPYSIPNIIINKNEELVLIMSDLHYGQLIRPDEINYINEYNSKIFEDRLNRLKEEIIIIAKRHNISRLHIFWVGDELENDRLFVIQKVMIDQFAVQQLMNCAEILSVFLRDLGLYFRQIENEIAPGNHGRLSEQRNQEHLTNNFEFILFWFIRERLNHVDNIKFSISFNFFVEKQIFDFWLLAVHGEWDKDQQKSMLAYSSMFNKNYTYLITGHWHSSKQLDVDGIKEVIVGGSFSGPTLYTVEQLKKATAPSQTAFTIRDRYGKYASYKILL